MCCPAATHPTPKNRTDRGYSSTWYGNKAIALVRCENVVLDGIRILNGGHFAIIAEGTRNMTVNDLIVDTNRDAYNIDCSQDVTVSNSHFNSLTDDAIVMKAYLRCRRVHAHPERLDRGLCGQRLRCRFCDYRSLHHR